VAGVQFLCYYPVKENRRRRRKNMLRVGTQAMLWKGQRVESSICIVFQAYYLFFENLMNIRFK